MHKLKKRFKLTRFTLLILSSFLFGSVGLNSQVAWSSDVSYQKIIEYAKKGSPYFQGLLGIYLRSGEGGCRVDLKLAKKWSEVAEKAGHPFGSYNLANLAMLKGDFESATRLYQDAALLLQRRASDGDPVAMYCMGEIDFQVIPTNVPRALELFNKSAEKGYPQAQATVGALLLKGLPGLLERNHKKGISLLSKAVESRSLTARYNLGMAYYNGDGVSKDASKAAAWLRIAEKQNFSEAQYTLGLLLVEGQGGISKNTSEGLTFLRKAASQGHQLAEAYLNKREGNKKLDATERLPAVQTTLGMQSANDEEILLEARKFYTGIGRSRDYEKAFELFFPLAQGGNSEAARFIGLMKLTGKGTSRDVNEARQWLSIASQKNDAEAKRILKEYDTLFR